MEDSASGVEGTCYSIIFFYTWDYHVIFTSSHIVILVIETYTELSPPQEDRHFSLIPVVVFLHSMVVVVEMDNYED